MRKEVIGTPRTDAAAFVEQVYGEVVEADVCREIERELTVAVTAHNAIPKIVERAVYQCPRCATSMEVDPSAKPSLGVPSAATIHDENEAILAFIGNLLDHWEQVPNDIKSDPGLEVVGRILGEIDSIRAGRRRSMAIHNMSQAAFDNLVRDAMLWRAQEQPQVVVDKKVFDMAHGLRPRCQYCGEFYGHARNCPDFYDGPNKGK